MNLLIVEDNEKTRNLLRRIVAGQAQVIYECTDGAEALSAYITHQPDWVLMDIRMPHLDGLTATQQIKAAFPQARIIIVTSFDEVEWRNAARQAGACGYVLKENLIELIPLLSNVSPTSPNNS
jgi:CheY-like chemotaxis protein